MNAGGELLIGLVMLVGVAGVVLPAVPGLLLVWGAALAWTLEVQGTTRWVVLAAVTVLCAAGTVAKYVLPGRRLQQAGAPASTMALGALGSVVGFFLIPVVGVVVGGVAGVYLGELNRLHSRVAAWTSTRATLRAIGVGILLEITAGLSAFAVWVVGAVIV